MSVKVTARFDMDYVTFMFVADADRHKRLQLVHSEALNRSISRLARGTRGLYLDGYVQVLDGGRASILGIGMTTPEVREAFREIQCKYSEFKKEMLGQDST